MLLLIDHMKTQLQITVNPSCYKVREIERKLEMFEHEVINIISSTLHKQPLSTLRCRPNEVNKWLKHIPIHLMGFISVIAPLNPDAETEKLLANLAYRSKSVRTTLKRTIVAEIFRWESGGSYLLELLKEGRSLCKHLLNHPGYDSCVK